MINLVKIAVVAAGGTNAVAHHFDVSGPAVSRWTSGFTIPLKNVRRLCSLSDNFVKPGDLLLFIIDQLYPAKAHAPVRRAHDADCQ